MSKLHEFDLELCEYARGNFERCFNNRAMLKRLERLKPEFKKYILTPRKFGKTKTPTSGLSFLLNDEELMEMENIAEMVQSFTEWIPHLELHKQATLCTGMINRKLAPAEGQSWASLSSRFIRRIESSVLSVAVGISILRDWLRELRRYKEAIGGKTWLPQPEGLFPTPTFPAPEGTKDAHSDDPSEQAIQRMRTAIQSSKKGRKETPKALISMAKINTKAGRDALQYLLSTGEYEGFSKARPSRYSRKENQ